MAGEITVRAGLCNAVACAPKGTSRKDVEAAANAQAPTGLDHGWKISRQRKLEDGTKLPARCLDDPGREHWLLDC